MELTGFSYNCSYSATTNPPTKSRKSVELIKLYDITLTVTEEANMVTKTSKYELTPEQLRKIRKKFEELKILEETAEFLKGEAPPEKIRLCGGSTIEGFSFTVNEITVNSCRMTDAVMTFIKLLYDIIPECKVTIDNFVLDRRNFFVDEIPKNPYPPTPMGMGTGMFVATPENTEEPPARIDFRKEVKR